MLPECRNWLYGIPGMLAINFNIDNHFFFIVMQTLFHASLCPQLKRVVRFIVSFSEVK